MAGSKLQWRAGAVFAMVALAGCTWLDPSMGMRAAPKTNVDTQSITRSIFSLPRFGFGANRPGQMSAQEKQCRTKLRRMGVQFEDISPIYDSASCNIAHPVKVSSLARGVALKPAATLNCEAALASAEWLQGDVAPAARLRYLSGVAEVRQMSSYSCRRIRGSGQWSEHSRGNALDIGAIELKNGRVIDVAKPGFFALREKAFLQAVRASACDDFSTVLGPGSDADHADHFHFDLRARKSGYRHCD